MWKPVNKAQVAELVDAIDSKSIGSNIMRVRFSPWAPEQANLFACVEESKGFSLRGKAEPKITWLCSSRFSPWAHFLAYLSTLAIISYMIYTVSRMKNTQQQDIGVFIKNLREHRGLTQGEFAKALGTSQSAVARMEKGEQNFGTDILIKISTVLDHKVVCINESTDFVINGGKKLHGTIQTNFSKNGAVGLLCASLINKGVTTLHGITQIEEVKRIIEVLESIGVNIKWKDKNTVIITPPKKFNLSKLNAESALKTRSIAMFIGPLIHYLPSFKLPHAKGCKLGKRTISGYTYPLEDIGEIMFRSIEGCFITAR